MQINIDIPESWRDFPTALRFKYVRILSQKGEVAAALAAVKGLMPKAYKALKNHGTEDHYIALVEAVEAIDGTEAIVPYVKYQRRKLYFPKRHMEHMALMVFAKCDELYGCVRSAIEEDDGARAVYYMYQLLLALTAPPMQYQAYSVYIEQPITEREKMQLAPYIEVALRYFTSNKLWIHDQYGELLFSGEAAGDAGIDLGWHGTAMSIAEAGAMGPLDQVYSTYLHTVLVFLVKKKQENDQIKRASQKSYGR